MHYEESMAADAPIHRAAEAGEYVDADDVFSFLSFFFLQVPH